MIALAWLLLNVPAAPPAPPAPPALPPPAQVRISTPRGETSVPLTLERGSAAVAVSLLAQPLALTTALDGLGGEATVGLGGVTFVFQLGLPFARAGAGVCANG